MTEYTDKDYEYMERYGLSPDEIDQMSDEELDEILQDAQEEISSNLEEGDLDG